MVLSPFVRPAPPSGREYRLSVIPTGRKGRVWTIPWSDLDVSSYENGAKVMQVFYAKGEG
jgi:hypothetical protein